MIALLVAVVLLVIVIVAVMLKVKHGHRLGMDISADERVVLGYLQNGPMDLMQLIKSRALTTPALRNARDSLQNQGFINVLADPVLGNNTTNYVITDDGREALQQNP
jgi:DNA-binding MarR family transcriptional regulator